MAIVSSALHHARLHPPPINSPLILHQLEPVFISFLKIYPPKSQAFCRDSQHQPHTRCANARVRILSPDVKPRRRKITLSLPEVRANVGHRNPGGTSVHTHRSCRRSSANDQWQVRSPQSYKGWSVRGARAPAGKVRPPPAADMVRERRQSSQISRAGK